MLYPAAYIVPCVADHDARPTLTQRSYADVAAVVLTPAPNATSQSVSFAVEYVLLADGILITEDYTVAAGGAVSVNAKLNAVGTSTLSAWLATARAAAAQSSPGSASQRLLQLTTRLAPPHAAPGEAIPRITRFGASAVVFNFDGESTTGITIGESRLDGNRTAVARVGRYGWMQRDFSLGPVATGHTIGWIGGPTGGHNVTTRNGYVQVFDAEVTPISTDTPSISYSLTVIHEF